MPTFAGARVPPPRAWDEFEDIVCSAAKNRWDNPNFTKHGRPGQKQDGVDIYGNDQNDQLVALQCKNTVGTLDEKTIRDEVEKAKKFDQQLSKLFIATTIETDRHLQKAVRGISRAEGEKREFEVHLLFWHDIWHDLTLDERRVFQHYPQLKPGVESVGGVGAAASASGGTAAPGRSQHDARLFDELQQALPFDPTVRLIRDHDFHNAFPREAVQPLFDFVETWDSPHREFINLALQAKLNDLYQAASKLAGEVVTLTVPVSLNHQYASVYAESVRAEGPRPAWVIEDGHRLNAASRGFFPLYEDFIRFGRRQLNQ